MIDFKKESGEQGNYVDVGFVLNDQKLDAPELARELITGKYAEEGYYLMVVNTTQTLEKTNKDTGKKETIARFTFAPLYKTAYLLVHNNKIIGVYTPDKEN